MRSSILDGRSWRGSAVPAGAQGPKEPPWGLVQTRLAGLSAQHGPAGSLPCGICDPYSDWAVTSALGWQECRGAHPWHGEAERSWGETPSGETHPSPPRGLRARPTPGLKLFQPRGSLWVSPESTGGTELQDPASGGGGACPQQLPGEQTGTRGSLSGPTSHTFFPQAVLLATVGVNTHQNIYVFP